jgi:hypothetical protein
MKRVINVTRIGRDDNEAKRPVVGVEAWQLLTELNEALFALAGLCPHVDRSAARVYRRETRSS